MTKAAEQIGFVGTTCGAQPRRLGPRMHCYGLTLTQPYRVLVGSTPMAR